MTNREAREWVHIQMILLDVDAVQLVEAFTVLTASAPGVADRRYGLFRRCCEVVIAAARSATPHASAGERAVPAGASRC